MPYESFDELQNTEQEGVDYTFEIVRRKSDVLIMAPHAGMIEPVTGRVARMIAGAEYSLYIFNAITGGEGRHCKMHVSSHLYDEPQALEVVRNAEIVVAVHGEKSLAAEYVMLGGLDETVKKAIKDELEKAGFETRPPGKHLRGISPDNICNRGKRGCGVQLEISALLRIRMKNDVPGAMEDFSRAVRNAIENCLKK